MPPWLGAAVAIGNFDGVHRGHAALVTQAVAAAKGGGNAAVVLSFDPHPARVLRAADSHAELTSLEQKAELVGALGARYFGVLPFTRALSLQEPADFVTATLGRLVRARVVVVGSGFRFGRARRGDLSALKEAGAPLGMRIVEVPPLVHGGEPISSSRVRTALARGEVELAGELLGRKPFLDGVVVRGDARGRTLGYPTANLEVHAVLLPAHGVYGGLCSAPDVSLLRQPAVINVGRRPTFGGVDTVVEAHLIDYAGDLYGRHLRVEFAFRVRPERAFAGVEALREQIAADVAEARARLEASAARAKAAPGVAGANTV